MGTADRYVNLAECACRTLGEFYSATTAFLGFKVQQDEYKVMGLAAMGTPKFASYLLDNVVALLPNGGFTVKPYFLDYHLHVMENFHLKSSGSRRVGYEEIGERHADIAEACNTWLSGRFCPVAPSAHAHPDSPPRTGWWCRAELHRER